MEEYCKRLPKIELHAHLNGSLSSRTLKKLGCIDTSVVKYQELVHLFAKAERNLNDCFELFSVAHKATTTKAAVYIATTDVINEFFEDNCVYLELRTTPRAEQGMSKRDYLESIVEAILHNDKDIIVKLLLCIDRRHAADVSFETVDLMGQMMQEHPNIIVGLDLCGNPNEGRFPIEVFVKAREMGIRIVLHCAEVLNNVETFQMLQFKPERLGHATFIHPYSGGAPQCWELYLKNPIPIECCLTSNVVCKTVSHFKNHHIKEWINNKLPFTLSTDDKGVFCTNLTNEYCMAQEHFSLTQDELWHISFTSIEYSFASDSEKQKLRNKLKEFYLYGY